MLRDLCMQGCCRLLSRLEERERLHRIWPALSRVRILEARPGLECARLSGTLSTTCTQCTSHPHPQLILSHCFEVELGRYGRLGNHPSASITATYMSSPSNLSGLSQRERQKGKPWGQKLNPADDNSLPRTSTSRFLALSIDNVARIQIYMSKNKRRAPSYIDPGRRPAPP
ncbi:hypothetical protein BDZ89DRAFT_67872 [Hymenopellis radicata]|nr:hypothetical protein BDZ89DRAFT_67872 [Hymenopellis radicata]